MSCVRRTPIVVRRTVLTLAVLMFVFGFHSPAFAEPDRCNDVLKQTKTDRVDNLEKKIAFLQLIESEQNWQSAKSLAGGLKAIYENIPIEATAKYDAFESWRDRELRLTSLAMNHSEAHVLSTTFLPADAISAWKDCISGGGPNGHGVRLAVGVESYTDSEATFHIYWTARPREVGTTAIPVHVRLGPTTTGGTLLTAWPSAFGTVTTTVDALIKLSRDKLKDLVVDVEVGDDKGGLSTVTARVPREPSFSESCKFDLTNEFRHVAHGQTFDLPICSGFKPGERMRVKIDDASISTDGPHPIWIQLDYSVNGGSFNHLVETCMRPVFPGDSVRECSPGPRPWAVSEAITIPWDGIVQVTIRVIRAKVFPGSTDSVTASRGTFSIVK